MKSAGYIVILLFATLSLASAQIRNKGWWQHKVFYQIYPKSFMDSDGDGIGDLKGITSKLQHFNDIGVGGIWLSPINKSPQVDNGYDISDFRDVDERFGSLTDLQTLIQTAKSLGLKVILDLVPNHTSDKHKWFNQSVYREPGFEDYYIWHNGKIAENGSRLAPNNWVSVFGGSGWTWNPVRQQYFYHQFYKEQPDLNYRNPKVQQEMKDIITFWLDKGMDGFRIDAVPHIIEGDISQDEPIIGAGANPNEHASFNHTLTKDQPETYEIIESWRKHVDKYAADNNRDEILLMTEAYSSLDNTMKYYRYGSHVPFNFKYITDADKTSTAQKFQTVAEQWLSSLPSYGVANWVMGNHDRNRVPTRYPNRGEQMIMLEMILPGVAVTYYGEEIGMEDYTEGTFSDFRDGCRTPMQWNANHKAGFTTGNNTWLPVNPSYTTVNVEAQKKDPKSHLSLYINLVKLRNSPVLMDGVTGTAVLKNEVFVVSRSLGNETIALLINFNDVNNVTVDVKDIMKNATSWIHLSNTQANLTLNTNVDLGEFTIPAKAAIVLSSAQLAPSSASSIGFSVVSILLIAIISMFQS